MSSSGLIYAVIVGAWAAYLVPMWLRRQDELNEARPTERFSTAIRLLSGRAAMERRYARAREEHRTGGGGSGAPDPGRDADADRDTEPDVHAIEPDVHVHAHGHSDAERADGTDTAPDASFATVDVRDLALPAPEVNPAAHLGPSAHLGHGHPAPRRLAAPTPGTARARVLARRRRTTSLLFLAFTTGAVAAGVGGLAYLWAPVVPGVLLSLYIRYLRGQERRRFEFVMDQRRAVEAARRLRDRPRLDPAGRPAADEPVAAAPRSATSSPSAASSPSPSSFPSPSPSLSEHGSRPARPARPVRASLTAGRRALVEQTDHAEWVDQGQQESGAAEDGWEPVPVPLPTYVTAPVAPRTPGSADPGAPDTWSSARSGPAVDPAPAVPVKPPPPSAHHRTPLFDQYAADPDRPRAANE